MVAPALEAQKEAILDMVVENQARNSAVPLLDTKNINARIEPGAIIRDQVELGDRAVIMMGAILNIGAVVGQGTMIDMGAVLGGRATVGKNCHVGAGAVLAGVIEPASATPVVIEDDVLIGANTVILEGSGWAAGLWWPPERWSLPTSPGDGGGRGPPPGSSRPRMRRLPGRPLW